MKLVGIVLACLLMAGLVGGKLPAVGDQVSIWVSGPTYDTHYWGTITDMDETMITIDYILAQKCNFYEGTTELPTEVNSTIAKKYPDSYRVCVGKDAISKLEWVPYNSSA
jgi:hypothetical protein